MYFPGQSQSGLVHRTGHGSTAQLQVTFQLAQIDGMACIGRCAEVVKPHLFPLVETSVLLPDLIRPVVTSFDWVLFRYSESSKAGTAC